MTKSPVEKVTFETLISENETLRTKNEKLEAVLKKLEWINKTQHGNKMCPYCEGVSIHYPNCEIAKALFKFGG